MSSHLPTKTSAITFHRVADARKRSPGQTTQNSHVCTIVYAGALRFHRKDCFSSQNACLIAATNKQRSFDRDGHNHRPKIVATMIGGRYRIRGTADCVFLRRQIGGSFNLEDHGVRVVVTLVARLTSSSWRRPAFSAALRHWHLPHSALFRVYSRIR